VTKIAPSRIVSMTMGLWLATSFFGNFLAGYLGSFWSSLDKAMFFSMIALIAAVAGSAIWAFERPLRPVMNE
jgi:POT family proton-dependent oligopeptide transporter